MGRRGATTVRARQQHDRAHPRIPSPWRRSGRPPTCSSSAAARSPRRWPTRRGCSGWTSAVTEDAAVAVASHERAHRERRGRRAESRPCRRRAGAGRRARRSGRIRRARSGPRHTQAARRDGLVGPGPPADRLARLHGPAGLDIDAHTPAEIAVSIVAEVLATGRAAPADRSPPVGPVHTAGVHAPPPRN